MRLTYSDLQNQFLRGTQNASNSSDTDLINFFQLKLQDRYQLCLAAMQNHQTQVAKQATTTASQQAYHNPPGVGSIESCTVDVGSQDIPLTVVHSQTEWNRINQYLISGSAHPLFIFPKRDTFEIWPIPGGAYTLNLNVHLRDRTLTVADYTTATVTLSNNATTLTGSGTTFTAAMVGRWFEVTAATSDGKGIWYRIASFSSTTVMALETSWVSSAASGVTYRIGQTPELPEELHYLCYVGPISDYFAEIRGNIEKATWFNNVFYTGDGNNNSRDPEKIEGGLIGAKTRYASRSSAVVIKRKPSQNAAPSLVNKMWATTVTE